MSDLACTMLPMTSGPHRPRGSEGPGAATVEPTLEPPSEGPEELGPGPLVAQTLPGESSRRGHRNYILPPPLYSHKWIDLEEALSHSKCIFLLKGTKIQEWMVPGLPLQVSLSWVA